MRSLQVSAATAAAIAIAAGAVVVLSHSKSEAVPMRGAGDIGYGRVFISTPRGWQTNTRPCEGPRFNAVIQRPWAEKCGGPYVTFQPVNVVFVGPSSIAYRNCPTYKIYPGTLDTNPQCGGLAVQAAAILKKAKLQDITIDGVHAQRTETVCAPPDDDYVLPCLTTVLFPEERVGIDIVTSAQAKGSSSDPSKFADDLIEHIHVAKG